MIAFVVSVCGAAEVDIQAKHLEYDEENKYVIATDSVTVTWGDRMLRAEKVEFWIEKEFLRAEQNVTLAESSNTIRGNIITYDYRHEKGEIDRANGTFESWFFNAERLQKTGDKKYATGRMDLTTCDLPHPHYTIRASRAKITLNKRVTVYNAVMYVGSVPVFYLPIWSQGLGPGTKYSLEIQPGYNDVDGVIVKTIFGYPLSAHSYGKLYLDYYSVRGWGKGAEYDYFDADRIKGSIYGYHMAENNTGNEYWSLRAAHWQKLDPLWTARADINYINSITFNNVYFQDNWSIVNNAMTSNLSFTRQDRLSNLIINFSRTDALNQATNEFEPQSITVPSLSYTRYSVIPSLPFSNTLSGTLNNFYTSGSGYYTTNGTLNANIRKGYAFMRKRLTFTPSLSVLENWSNRDVLGNLSDTFVTHYLTDLNLRWRLSRLFSWDVGYSLNMRTLVNSLYPDYEAVDYGIETSRVYFQNYFSKGRVSVRNATGYDLRINRGEVIDDWRRKLNPLVNEVTWLPGNFVTLFFREENVIYPAALNSLSALASVGQPERTYGSFGVFYNGSAPDDLGFTTGFGFWPTSKWKLDYQLSATSLNRFQGFRLGEQEIRLYRDLHCWEFKISYRKRPVAEEVYFQLNLKISAANRSKIQQQSKEFYPWRH